jgi:hypothetical protein
VLHLHQHFHYHLLGLISFSKKTIHRVLVAYEIIQSTKLNTQADIGPVHLAYNPSYSACFFSRNSIFLSQKISQHRFSAGL